MPILGLLGVGGSGRRGLDSLGFPSLRIIDGRVSPRWAFSLLGIVGNSPPCPCLCTVYVSIFVVGGRLWGVCVRKVRWLMLPTDLITRRQPTRASLTMTGLAPGSLEEPPPCLACLSSTTPSHAGPPVPPPCVVRRCGLVVGGPMQEGRWAARASSRIGGRYGGRESDGRQNG